LWGGAGFWRLFVVGRNLGERAPTDDRDRDRQMPNSGHLILGWGGFIEVICGVGGFLEVICGWQKFG